MTHVLLDADALRFQAEVRDFFARELAPRAAAIEEQDDWQAVKAVARAVGEAGWLRLMFPDLYRGWLPRPGLTHATLLSEEAARVNYAFETTIATALSCAYPLHRHASPAVRGRYLEAIVAGSAVGAICVTEPDAGSDTARLATRITRDQLQIGDLVFWSSNGTQAGIYHVAMYAGAGQVIQAPRPGRTVEVVTMWEGNLFGFGRV